MTRILVWNIRDFSVLKVLDPGDPHAADRQALITDVFTNVVPPPAIVVVVEVEVASAYQGPGPLAPPNAIRGCNELLTNALRGPTGNANWMLVPPLVAGSREAVAIFYDSTQLFFTGPWLWSGGLGGMPLRPGPGTIPGNYPVSFNGFFPAPVRQIPGAGQPNPSQYNPGAMENQCAASVEFTQAAPPPGRTINYPRRFPYMCTFQEIAGAQRNITVFAVHTAANRIGAPADMLLMTQTAEIVDAIGPNEVRVLCGDFNVNVLDAALALDPSYAQLMPPAGPYTLGLAPVPPPPPTASFMGYFATHIHSPAFASIFSTQGSNVYYPGYAYMSRFFYAIDNMLVWYGAAAGPPPPTNFTILNSVVGAPLDAPPPAWNWPANTNTLNSPAVVIPPPAPAIGPPFVIGDWRRFSGWNQYGKVHGTSDHFAVVMDV